MPRRTFKSMLVEVVSFLTLFTLVGTMSSNFWERYLIQNELSDMKSSLYILKETIFNIGNAYDNLNHELKELVDLKVTKSSNSMPKESKLWTCYHHENRNDQTVFRNNLVEELMKLKANKSIGITTSKEVKETCSRRIPEKGLLCEVHDATTITRYPRKESAVNSEPEKSEGEVSLTNNYKSSPNDNIVNTNIHRCSKEANCLKQTKLQCRSLNIT